MPPEFTNLWVGSAIVAAVISGIVASIGIIISNRTAKSIHTEKLSFDKNITNQKADFDIALARKKFDLDRSLALWKRKTELAEEILAMFYEAQRIITSARFPGSFGNEGSSRKPFEWETEDDKRMLDSYYATVERLQKENELLSKLHSKRFRAMALLGKEALKPFEELFGIYNEIIVAVRMLMKTYRHDKFSQKRPDNRNKWEATMGWGIIEEDPIVPKLDALILKIENICKPLLEVQPQSTAIKMFEDLL